MGRTFDFKQETKQQAFHRQAGRCACCNGNLKRDYVAREKEVHAHHVTPNQAGRSNHQKDRWLSGPDNCVVVCDDCHRRVHENGRYRDGAMAPAGYFPHSHGGDRNAHQAWAAAHEQKTDAHYADLVREERMRRKDQIRTAAQGSKGRVKDAAAPKLEEPKIDRKR